MAKKALEPPRSQSWMPIDGESASAYAAFCVYKDLGVGRKLTKVEEALSGMPGGAPNYLTLVDWKSKFSWEERVIAHDRDMAEFQSQAERDARRKSVQAIEKERFKRVQINCAMADELRMRAMDMLGYPHAELVVDEPPVLQEDGKTLIVRKVYQPVKWTAADVPKYLDVAMRLEKMALFDEHAKVIEVTVEKKDQAQSELEEWRQESSERLPAPEIPPAPPGSILPSPDEPTREDG